MRFELSSTAIHTASRHDLLRHPANGGYCSFEGWVRNHNEGRQVTALEYEAYAELAITEGERIIEEALKRYGAMDARCVHRIGRLRVGELAVWIGVSAAHRAEAFRACRYIIDEIKHRLPIWKKEHDATGASAWVLCTHHGDADADADADSDVDAISSVPG